MEIPLSNEVFPFESQSNLFLISKDKNNEKKMNLFIIDFGKKIIKFAGEYDQEESFKILNAQTDSKDCINVLIRKGSKYVNLVIRNF